MGQTRQMHSTHEPREAPGELRLSSASFADGARIPTRFTADGDAVSPPLTWSDGPAGTESYALIADDPDAPSGTFTHWLAWNIKADEHRLVEDFPGTADTYGVRQGENDFGGTGYGAPSPPPGPPHRYVFRLFALDTKPDLKPGANREQLERAIDGHILSQAQLTGIYGR